MNSAVRTRTKRQSPECAMTIVRTKADDFPARGKARNLGGAKMEDDPTPDRSLSFVERRTAFVSIQDRMELSCSATNPLPVFLPLPLSVSLSLSFQSLSLIQVWRRWYETEEKKPTWVGKKDEGGGRIIPEGNRRGGNLSRNNELCAIDFLLYTRAGETSSRRLLVFISLCHREKGKPFCRFLNEFVRKRRRNFLSEIND